MREMMPTHEWDARAYERLSDPQFAWGLRVLERLPLRGDESVMDAGCGSGRLTRKLAERLPSGRIVAVDRSENMIAEACARLVDVARIDFTCADLTTFVAPTPVDAVFSTATFHWIQDHDRLFASVAASLAPGGRLVAQCGGAGNLARFHDAVGRVSSRAPFAQALGSFAPSWSFQNEADTARRLRAAGLAHVACDLELAPTTFPDDATFRDFVRTVVLRQHLAALPSDAMRLELLDQVVALALAENGASLDYVRLNLSARRPD